MNTHITRTTVRLNPSLKKAAEKKALEKNITFQELFTQAVTVYLKQESKKKARKLIFKTKSLGVPLDELTREDLYAD